MGDAVLDLANAIARPIRGRAHQQHLAKIRTEALAGGAKSKAPRAEADAFDLMLPPKSLGRPGRGALRGPAASIRMLCLRNSSVNWRTKVPHDTLRS